MHLLDTLIGWDDAQPGTRARLLRASCAGVHLQSLIGNSIALIVLTGVILIDTREPAHFGWLVCVILGGLLPRLYARRLRRMDRFDQDTTAKALWLIALNGVYGILWGAGALLLLPDIDGAALGILLFLLVFGTVMGPYAGIPGILYIRLATTGTLTMLAIYWHTTPQILLAAAIALAWLVLRSDVWRGYHRALRRQIELTEAQELRQQALENAHRQTQKANRVLQQVAATDPLTGIANRRHFMQELDGLRGPAALILFDLDHFKTINDGFGHQSGDNVLIEVVARVQAVLRKGDLLARLGGDEFAIILDDVSPAAAHQLAERIRTRVAEQPIRVGELAVPVTFSLGIAVVPPDDPPVAAAGLLHDADAALYAAKHEGRNCIRMADAAGG